MSNDLDWFKSSYSGDQGGACVEVAFAAPSPHSGTRSPAVHVRDSKDTARPGLALSPSAWSAFLAHTADTVA